MSSNLATRKKAGVTLGRPRGSGKSKLDTYRPEIESLLKNGSTQRFIARRYETTPANLNRWLNKHKLLCPHTRSSLTFQRAVTLFALSGKLYE